MNQADRWIFRALLCLFVWLPLPLASNRTWASGIMVAFVTVMFFAAMFVWRNYVPEVLSRLRQCRLPLILFGIFIVVSVLQVAPLPDSWIALLSPEAYRVQVTAGLQGRMHLSLDLYQSKLALGLTCTYFAVFVMVLVLVRDAKRVNTLLQTMVLSGLFQALMGIFLFSISAQYHLFYVELFHENVIGTFVNRNHFAGYMEMMLAMGIGLMIARLGESSGSSYSGWRHRLVSILTFVISPKMRLRLMLVIMVIALVLTRSRMGNSAFFSAMLIVGVITILLARKSAPATAALILSLVVVDVVVVGTWVGLEKVVNRINDTTVVHNENQVEESVEDRTLPAILSMQMVKDFPLFGTGGGSFYNAFSRYRTPEVIGYFDHTHNDYAEITTDMGVIGAAALGLMTLSGLMLSLKMIRQRRSSLPRGLAFGVAMSIVAIAIHSAVDFNLQIPANALTFVIILALAWVAKMHPSRRKSAEGDDPVSLF